MEENISIEYLKKLAKLIRYFILTATTEAGSGHPTSSLSATDLMTCLFFSSFRFDFDNPGSLVNDRLIFSKGHASPLLYSLYTVAGIITYEELLRLRKYESFLEGHPTPRFKYCEAATGSLGQGLSVGVGMALAIKNNELSIMNNGIEKLEEKEKSDHNSLYIIHNSTPRVFVLLGDGEMAEGSVWEAMEIASYYKLNNLTAIVDVNRLGQSGETKSGWDLSVYEKKALAFGWETIIIEDGNDMKKILEGLERIRNHESGIMNEKPTMVIAKTIKGKGVSFLENKEGWHGKPLDKEQLAMALVELGEVDLKLRGEIRKPKNRIMNNELSIKVNKEKHNTLYIIHNSNYKIGDMVATREAYGDALVELGKIDDRILVLDGDVKGSTYSEKFQKVYPDRFLEMFIAEQNMIGASVGLAKLGFKVFASSFGAFLTRAYDQIRMAALSDVPLRLCGSHAGVSIGEDGPSQMALEDMAMVQAVYGSVILYPSDAVSSFKCTYESYKYDKGITYLRTTRGKMPVIYDNNEEFPIGKCKIHKSKIINHKSIIIVAAGITVREALAAQKELEQEGISITVIDCYSIKPLDGETLRSLARQAKTVITVEDHYTSGGLGDAVIQALCEENSCPVYKMAVTKMPRSGKPEELLAFEEIDKEAIVGKVRFIMTNKQMINAK